MIVRQDNTVMKSIALLGMTFLPATFVSVHILSALFSFHLTHTITGILQYDLLRLWRRQLASVKAIMDLLGDYYPLHYSGYSYMAPLAT